MNGESKTIHIIRIHKKWADFYTLVSQFLIIVIFTAAYYPLDQAGLGAAERAGAFVLLATVILATIIWQALGLAIARLHMLRGGIDLERRTARDGNQPRG